ncbi:MAG: hypothetical protein AAF525_07335 [Pseudomonadota bacterium]
MTFIADRDALARAVALAAMIHASVLAGFLVPTRDVTTGHVMCLSTMLAASNRTDIRYFGADLEIPTPVIQQLVACLFCLDSLDVDPLIEIPELAWRSAINTAPSFIRPIPGRYEIRISARDPPQQHT